MVPESWIWVCAPELRELQRELWGIYRKKRFFRLGRGATTPGHENPLTKVERMGHLSLRNSLGCLPNLLPQFVTPGTGFGRVGKRASR
jgi:hypothetical protein